MKTEGRIQSLDSLRGISAMIVVIFHCVISFPMFYNAFYSQQFKSGFMRILTDSPLHVVWAGPEAVMLFFVLSGFVLSLPFLSENKPAPSYGRFAIKRFCRIYIPYIVVMVIYMAVITALSDYRTFDALSPTFNARWAHPIPLKAVVSYFLMIDYDSGNVNGVIWSLIHEMRISLIFPLIIYFVKKLNWKLSLPVGLAACLIVNIGVTRYAQNHFGGDTLMLANALAAMVYYIPFFIMGAVLAKYRLRVTACIKGFYPVLKALLILAALVLFTFKWVFYDFQLYAANHAPKLLGAVQDWAIAAGVVLLFAVVLSSEKAQWLLTRRFFSWLGKTSYSIYLIHVIVIMLDAKYLSRILPMSVAIMLSPLIVLPVAGLVNKFVEQPAMRLGKRLSEKKSSSSFG